MRVRVRVRVRVRGSRTSMVRLSRWSVRNACERLEWLCASLTEVARLKAAFSTNAVRPAAEWMRSEAAPTTSKYSPAQASR